MKYLALSALFLLPAMVQAQSVDLFASGNGYVPPFYLGGAPWTSEGKVTLLAVPQGLGDPTKLNYRWSRGTTALGDLSGVGESILTLNDSVFSKPQIFSVEIMDAGDNSLASSFVTLTPQAPSLLIYEKNPLYGFLFNHEASQGYRLTEQEVTFAAFPLFFSSLTREGSLTYSWHSSTGEDSTESSVTYRIPDKASGSANVSVEATNPKTIRQAARQSFLVQFGNDNG